MDEPKDRSPERNLENDSPDSGGGNTSVQRTFIYRVLRYVPSPLRDEWVNVGVLLYDPNTGERRLRLIEEESEFTRVRRLRPAADEAFLRGLRNHLESRLSAVTAPAVNGEPIRSTLRNGHGNPLPHSTEWFPILEKWDATLSHSIQLAGQQATYADDIDAEMDRLYRECITASGFGPARTNQPSTREQMRDYMDQVIHQAGLWGLIEKFVPASKYTLDKDPLKIDYSYLRSDNRMRGFIQTISLTTKPDDVRILAPIAKTIQHNAGKRNLNFGPEFTAVTDVAFEPENDDHRFLEKMLRGNGVTSIPLDNFAVFVAKLRPMLQ